ncbi:LysR substrate-binding domain-containing protein [uncultured Bacteroides sp.]|uniref:LysR substrate-binding domain-containing protein n=1 Tax=uncultured Bacteroides sp. TaxID=162156 RepID=UPI002AA8D8FF|nr:LysR substrate-binding domain-containing protein [uncultured Bacteroides sp.]
MELRQLRYFERSAELLNFTEAARLLFISQSTLSQQIKQLEEEFGTLLFDRIGKRIKLTEAGASFLPYARKTIQDAENGKQIISDLQNMQTGTLLIGVTYSLSTMLTGTLIEFTKRYPQIHVEIIFATSAELIEKLNENKLDFILSLEPNIANSKEEASFESVPLFTSNLHLVMHKSHKLSKKLRIRIEQLSGLPLALPSKGFITRMILDRVFERKQVTPKINIELNDINTILHLVNTSNWLTIVTIASIEDQPELVAIPITGADLTTHASLFWPKGIYRKKAATAFSDLLLNRKF